MRRCVSVSLWAAPSRRSVGFGCHILGDSCTLALNYSLATSFYVPATGTRSASSTPFRASSVCRNVHTPEVLNKSRSGEAVQEEWNVSPEILDAARHDAHQLGLNDDRVVFLFAKGVFVNRGPRMIKSLCELVLYPQTNQEKLCRQRLERVLNIGGDTVYTTQPADWHTLEDLLVAIPAWGAAYIFHVAHGLPLRMRLQPSGLCYIHAPEMVQSYLVSKENKGGQGDTAVMIDMSKMIRRNFVGDQLFNHVFDDQGGDSKRMLQAILLPGSVTVASSPSEYERNLKAYGPGLVSGFAVHDDFYDAHTLSFKGVPKGKKIGYHAMVLIGVREEAGQQFYLLQNWWKKLQFVEVSESYMRAAGATVHFVVTPQTSIPTEFPTHAHYFSENENLDKPEELMAESPLAPPAD